MRPLAATLLCAAAIVAAACSPETSAPPPPAGDADDWQGTIEERDGVVHVRNPTAGLWDDAATPPIRFEPDGVYGGPDSRLSSIAGAVVDRDGNLHVFDAIDAELVKLARDGSVMHRVGSAGSGATEFNGVRGIAYDGEASIYVVNQEGTRLDAWSIDGDHEGTMSVEELGLTSVYMGGFVDPRRLALIVDDVHNMAMNEYAIVELGEQPSIGTRFDIGAEPMVPIPPGVVLQLSHSFHDGQILVGTWEQYVLRVFDADGSLRRRVTRPVDYLRRPGFALQDEQYLGVALGGLAAPIVLDSGHWLVFATWPTNVDNPNDFAETPASERPAIEWASSLDLFDDEGRYLTSLRYPGSQAPDIGRPWTTGPDGALYTVTADPFPQVRRYRVIIEPPARH
jgi:hypothetical protein